MQDLYMPYPFVSDEIVRGENEYLIDKHGNKYLDMESGIWCSSLGHAQEELAFEMYEQARRLLHVGKRFTTREAGEAANHVIRFLGRNDGKVLFLNSGSEPVEFGITAMKTVTRREKIFSFTKTYVGAYGHARSVEELVDIDQCIRCNKKECTRCEQVTKINFNEYAGFVFEPGCFHGAILFPPNVVVVEIASNVKKTKGYVAIDEVTTGFGRMGKRFGFQYYDITPDIVCMGKTLGNGYPVSAVFLSESIVEQLDRVDFCYVQSHENDPLGCRVASWIIHALETSNLVERSSEQGKQLLRVLEDKLKGIDVVNRIRGRGLMIGIDIKESCDVRRIHKKMYERRYIIGISPQFNCIRLLPPLTIDENTFEGFSKDLADVIVHECT